jgi:hypothetical protein
VRGAALLAGLELAGAQDAAAPADRQAEPA